MSSQNHFIRRCNLRSKLDEMEGGLLPLRMNKNEV